MPKIPGNAPIRTPMPDIDPTILAMAEASVVQERMRLFEEHPGKFYFGNEADHIRERLDDESEKDEDMPMRHRHRPDIEPTETPEENDEASGTLGGRRTS